MSKTNDVKYCAANDIGGGGYSLGASPTDTQTLSVYSGRSAIVTFRYVLIY